MADDSAILFNCCTDGAEPDWSAYEALKIGGCKIDPDDPGCTLGGVDGPDAEFWTVYAVLKNGIGECEAITDCATREMALAVVSRLSGRSGLPIT